MTQNVDLLVLPRWIVPVEPLGTVLERHAMAVDQGRIVGIVPLEQARERYRPAETLELPDKVVMPGLVNAHTHAAMSLFSGVADDLPLMEWLQNHIWPAEGAHVGEQFCEDGVRLALAEMVRSGTTCINDMYFFPDVTARVAAEAGVRATVGLIVLDFPTAWARDADEYIRKGLDLHDAVREIPLAHSIFAPHAPYTVSDTPLTRVRRFANELGIGVHMHLHETADEIRQSLQQFGKRPWQRLRELEMLGPDFVAVHMTQLTDEEIAQAAEYGVHVVHCPESNLKLASGFAPIGKLITAGVNVAIGTDGAASNNDLDLLGETRTAALVAKAVAGDARTLPAPEALRMATLGGARALGLDAEIGSLETGKSADFIAIDLSAPNTQPIYNVISQLVYAVGREQVTDVFVAGRALMRDRHLLTIDQARALAQAAHWQQKIHA
ncbi:MAG: TRZ/ATZ family hydrolase [Nevskiales bacterium]|nr:TRZ/ATZ family hydrolase [Nevskiales bacterium]